RFARPVARARAGARKGGGEGAGGGCAGQQPCRAERKSGRSRRYGDRRGGCVLEGGFVGIRRWRCASLDYARDEQPLYPVNTCIIPSEVEGRTAPMSALQSLTISPSFNVYSQ